MKKLFLIFSLLLSACISLCAQDRKSLRDSLVAATNLLEYHPDSLDLRLKKAAWNLQLEQWQYAKDEYDFILSRVPNNVSALYYRAYANEKLGCYKFARLDYEHVLTRVPGNFQSLLGLALLNQKDHRSSEAFDQINRLVSQYPDSAVAYAARAGIEKERNMNDLALFDYEEAIKRDPQNTDYRLERIDILLSLRKREHARRALDDLIRMGVPRAMLVQLYKRCTK